MSTAGSPDFCDARRTVTSTAHDFVSGGAYCSIDGDAAAAEPFLNALNTI